MHTVERAAIFAESEQIGIEAFRPTAVPGTSEGRTPPSSVREAVDQVEEDLIRATMERLRGNKKRVAAELGISRSYLYKRLAELNLN